MLFELELFTKFIPVLGQTKHSKLLSVMFLMSLKEKKIYK